MGSLFFFNKEKCFGLNLVLRVLWMGKTLCCLGIKDFSF